MTKAAATSFYTFMAPGLRALVNDSFRHILEAVSVHQFNPGATELSIEGATINDWWIIHVTGKGTFRFQGSVPKHVLNGRARLTFVLSGNCTMQGERNYFGRPGEICLSRWEYGDYVSHSGNFDYLVIFLPVADLERIFQDPVPYGRMIPTFGGPGAVVGTILKSWIDEALSGRAPEFLESISEDFLRLVLRSFTNSLLSEPFPETAATRRLHRVMGYLRRNLSDPDLAPVRVARECGVSERQLYRDFAAEGTKFSGALRRLRLEEAALRLVRDQDEHVADISRECGFVCPAHFARVFRQAYGEAPRDYRERYRDGDPDQHARFTPSHGRAAYSASRPRNPARVRGAGSASYRPLL